MPPRRFRIVNVFAEAPLAGNPLCVFEDGSGLDDGTMQALALQFNLSETTFILPADSPGATARVRIFTPTFEIPFAGHPTLGTAHVVRDLLGEGDAVRLAMKAGVIPVTAEGDVWTLEANAPEWRAAGIARAQLAEMLGLDESDVREGARWVDTGSEQLIARAAQPGREATGSGLRLGACGRRRRQGAVLLHEARRAGRGPRHRVRLRQPRWLAHRERGPAADLAVRRPG
jgi:trans-2,3-dihydro-3-hydroxyanthranilate isomerase